ncbi:MAG: hypothetical protein HQL32_17085 [Planctomycetes bacterium]|nr:hypothetical protein [Planctomycetota bacterium]
MIWIRDTIKNDTTIVKQAPYSHQWAWKSLVNDPSSVQAVSFDFNGDGIAERSGLADDPSLETITHTFSETGSCQALMSVLLKSGERFSFTTRLNLTGSSALAQSLSLSSTLSSAKAPATLTLQGAWTGVLHKIEKVQWSLGLDPEQSIHKISKNLNISFPLCLPGSYPIKARVYLKDGQVVEVQKDIHLAANPLPYIIAKDHLERPFQTKAVPGQALESSVWPPQASVISQSFEAGVSENSLHPQAETSVTGSSSTFSFRHTASLSFHGDVNNSQATQSYSIVSSPSLVVLPHERIATKIISWQSSSWSSLALSGGSSIKISAQDINNSQSMEISTLAKTGLTLKGVPAHLNTLERDVAFNLNLPAAYERPDSTIELSLAYDDKNQDGLIDDLGVSEDDIVVMRFDLTKHAWVPVEGYYTHPDLNVVRIKSNHLSIFGLFYPGLRAIQEENNSAGGCLLR